MSPRAAWRLESIGFTEVHDYVAGKADWGSAGLPLEGTRGSETRVGADINRDVPTCRLDERLADVRAQVRAAGWDACFVVNDEQVVLGRLGRTALAGAPGDIVWDAYLAFGKTSRWGSEPSGVLASGTDIIDNTSGLE